MIKKYVITGAAGFIGKNLVKDLLLQKNSKIYLILRKSKKNQIFSKKFTKEPNYVPIFFNDTKELKKKFKRINADAVINLATYYVDKHNFEDIEKIISSNILFCSQILELSCEKRIKNFINICSVMQLYTQNKYPLNFYAASKDAFKNIGSFYSKNYDIKFFNLFIGDTYGDDDKRKKIIPIILKNYEKNKTTKIMKKKLELNILHVKDIINAISIILRKKIKTGDYLVRSKTNIKLDKLISNINKGLKRKIKITWGNSKFVKIKKITMRLLPGWKQNFNIETEIKRYLNEN